MKKRPNILWLTSDQQRFDTIHALGHALIDTPYLDKLCSEGVAFRNNYCQNPICTPSRASFLSGRYPSAVNANINGAENLPEHCTLITKRLADAGYRCGLFGKLHITSAWDDREDRMEDGYTDFHLNLGSGHHLWSDHNPYKDWLEEKGVNWQDILTSDEQHDYCWYREDAPVDLRQTAWLHDSAIDFIRAHKDDEQPWLLSVNCYDPHPPYDAPKDMVEKYLQRDLPDPVFNQNDVELDKNLSNFFFQSSAKPVTDVTRRQKASYYAMVEIVDRHYGQIIQALDEMGLREDTVVIFHSDHGEMLGDHGLTHKGCRFYEGLVHVPLIISWPGHIEQGKVYDGLTELTDVAPTIAEICGVDMPDAHGRSLLPLMKGEAYAPRKYVRTEYYDTLEEDPTYDGLRSAGEITFDDSKGKGSYASMYFDGKYKLCVYHGIDFGEMYDLEKDPEEHNNLWNQPEFMQTKMKLLMDSFNVSVRFSRPGQTRRGRY